LKRIFFLSLALILLFGISAIAQTEVKTVNSAGQIWMDRNLGATQVATGPTDSAAYGDLYQWGRLVDGHQNRSSSITSNLSSKDTPGHGKFITTNNLPLDWRIPQNNKLWQGTSGINNPCPAGFRLPTLTELEMERKSWSSNDAKGAFASPLKLVLAGTRSFIDGTLGQVGKSGAYWSSSVDGNNWAHTLLFIGTNAYVDNNIARAMGGSVRCIMDNTDPLPAPNPAINLLLKGIDKHS